MQKQKIYLEQKEVGNRKFKEVEECIFVNIGENDYDKCRKQELFVCHDPTPNELEQEAQLHNIPMLYLVRGETKRNVVIDRIWNKKMMMNIVNGYTLDEPHLHV
jgi:hypothetical protein